MKELDLLISDLISGNLRALAKAITLVESKNPSHRLQANELINKILPNKTKSFRLAISGIPGVGKSTFIEKFGLFLAKKNKKIAVLAIDPSSSITGGSIMADKTRMEHLVVHPNVFVRPTASGGKLGGIARNTYESILLCEAAGYDFIIIETIGVGQSETLARDISDYFLFLNVAGTGDELQGIKRGIMEMADMVFLNKSEIFSPPILNKSKVELMNALHYFPRRGSEMEVKVLSGSGLNEVGFDEIWDELLFYQEKTKENGFFESNRENQLVKRFQEVWLSQLQDNLMNNPNFKSDYDVLTHQILNKKKNLYQAVTDLLKTIKIEELDK